ncbi:excalibur calcium-binding domain-containing protein [Streptomyces sp. NPDC006355]|uniref:excalibur calcium-binding domain-containing protein n=1 Tax=Streptomyces sp. NPDC006355 TaxID=3156758 RepID=UPI0033AB8820
MGRLVHPGILSLLVTAVIGVTGCQGTDSTPTQNPATVTNTITVAPTTPTPTPPPTPTPEPTETPPSPERSTPPVPERSTPPAPASPRPAESPTADSASSVVRDYFAAINARDYRRAWDLGGKNLSGSYEAFVDGFATTAHDTVHILRADGGTVSVTLEATQTDGTLRLFEGTYTVRGGTIVGADIREVTEPDPPPDEASPYYENCDAARAAGDAPLFTGDPGYAPHLDRDGDGEACEPYPP